MINTKHEQDIIRNAACRIMSQYDKLGSGDLEMEVWDSMDTLLEKIVHLVDEIENAEVCYAYECARREEKKHG